MCGFHTVELYSLESGHFRGRLIVDATKLTVAYRSQNLQLSDLTRTQLPSKHFIDITGTNREYVTSF